MRACLGAFVALFLFSNISFAANDSRKSLVDKLNKKFVDKTCEETPFLKTSQLACVSCGVEKYTGVKPSEKFLAMIGFATTKYSFLGKTTNERGTITQYGHPSQGGKALELFQQNVIQKIQAHGFCVDGKINKAGDIIEGKGYGGVPNSMRDLIFRALSGSTSSSIPVVNGDKVTGRENSLGYTSKELKDIVKFFGFQDIKDIEKLYDIQGWTYMSPAERQKIIRDGLASVPENNPYSGETSYFSQGMYSSNENGDGLKECVKQMNELVIQKDSVFNLKSTNSANQELCQLMAIECDIDLDFCTNTPKPGTATPANSNPEDGRAGRNLFKATQTGVQ